MPKIMMTTAILHVRSFIAIMRVQKVRPKLIFTDINYLDI